MTYKKQTEIARLGAKAYAEQELPKCRSDDYYEALVIELAEYAHELEEKLEDERYENMGEDI